MANGEEENNELDELEDLLGEEELTDEEETEEFEVPTVNDLPESQSTNVPQYNSIFDLIQKTFNTGLFYFSTGFSKPSDSSDPYGNYVAGSEGFISIREMMTDASYEGFITDELKESYTKIIENPSVNVQEELAQFVQDVGDTLLKGQRTQVPIRGSEASYMLTINKKKTRKGMNGITYETSVNEIKAQDFGQLEKTEEQLKAQEEVTQKQKEVQETIVTDGIVRTSSPAWGYTTDNEGYQTIETDGKKDYLPAPFWKGMEYSLFSDMEQSDVFRLQQSMVAAGMKAPPVDQYGMWTDREANFMSILFIKATDNGNARKDQNNGLGGWETQLTQMSEDYSATEAFMAVLNKRQYGQGESNVSPAMIKSILDTAAAANGIELSANDYVNFASVVTNAMQAQSEAENAFNSSLITDRDIILNSRFMDARAIRDEDTPSRFFKGNSMPLVLPSYDWMTQQKGGTAPTVIPYQEIVNEQIAKLKSNQIAGRQTLNDVKTIANLFESSMGAIGYGDD
tara:strand:- start:1346 stop:2881 length:1536 start_codon:yes stop_codon:yes gene_type:complete